MTSEELKTDESKYIIELVIKDKLRKEAKEWLSITDNHLNDERTHFLSESEYAEQAYLAGAEPREKRIAELEAQIEKMKCCSNCQTVRDAEGNCYLKKDGKCKNKDKWELRR